MTVRVVFLGEGTSDGGLVTQIAAIAARENIDVAITDPDLARLPTPPGRAVDAKLLAVTKLGGIYDLIVVHRDADNQGVRAREREIADAVASVADSVPHVPVIPVRMTEAWLLTSEEDLRWVAGNPNGKAALNLPTPAGVERVADPKALLREVLARASGATGRRLDRVHQRFAQHRRQLLERLDPFGPVSRLASWQHFVAGIQNGLKLAAERVDRREP